MSTALLHPPARLRLRRPTALSGAAAPQLDAQPLVPATAHRVSAAFLPPRRQPLGLIAVAAVHAALVWWLLQADLLQQAVQRVSSLGSPLVVALLPTPAPPRPSLPAPAALPRQAVPLPAMAALPVPDLRVADAAPAPAQAVPVSTAADLPVPTAADLPVPAPANTAPAAPSVPAPALAAVAADAAPLRLAAGPVAMPAPPVLAASAIRYRVPPAMAVPMASRRLGEAGTVLLRVWVDAQGLPQQIELHRSSGFARLDAQAQDAMRQARFQPVTEGGTAIAWVVIAALQYAID